MKPVQILLLPVLSSLLALDSFAQTWQAVSTGRHYFQIAASADGTKLFAAAGDSRLYTSTNSGITWNQITVSPQNVTLVSCSVDGTKIIENGSGIVILTNSETGWGKTNFSISGYWNSFACSADGSKLMAAARTVVNPGVIFSSNDGGMTWVSNSVPGANWYSVASSADGSKLVACINGGGIYTSTNSGNTWLSNNVPSEDWYSVASSADGKKFVAVGADYYSGYIFTSTNSGVTWISNDAPQSSWQAVASSADGNKLVAACNGGIYTNSGTIWKSAGASSANWDSVTISADGTKIFAGIYEGDIYTLQTLPLPNLNLSLSNETIVASWLVPSTNFVLQSSSNLSTWTDLTNQPVLNLTNLQNEVSLPLSEGSGFYRLKTP